MGLIVMTLITIIAVTAIGVSCSYAGSTGAVTLWWIFSPIAILWIICAIPDDVSEGWLRTIQIEAIICVGGALALLYVWSEMPWGTLGIVEGSVLLLLYLLWKVKILCFHTEREVLGREENIEAKRFGYPAYTVHTRCNRCGREIEHN